MKKKLILILTLFFTFFLTNTKVFAENKNGKELDIYVDGIYTEVSNFLDTKVNRTYVAINGKNNICKAIGVDCNYDDDNRVIKRNIAKDSFVFLKNQLYYYTEFQGSYIKNTFVFSTSVPIVGLENKVNSNFSNTQYSDGITLKRMSDATYVPIRFFMQSYWFDVKWTPNKSRNDSRKGYGKDRVDITTYNMVKPAKISGDNGIYLENGNSNCYPTYFIDTSTTTWHIYKNLPENVSKIKVQKKIVPYGYCFNKFYLGRFD